MNIIPNDFGERLTPSYVAFTEKEKLVGNKAKDQIKTVIADKTESLTSLKQLSPAI